jgi:hypothetical protein
LLPGGSGSDVTISGVGAVATTCKDIMNGTIKPGHKIKVSVDKIDAATGKVMASIATTKQSWK